MSREVAVKNTPCHWRDIMSNDMSVTTLPVRSPLRVISRSVSPRALSVPRTTIDAPSWKYSSAAGSTVSVTPGDTTSESNIW